MKKTLYILCQLTWGLPQSIAGLFVMLANKNSAREKAGSSEATFWKSSYGLSMGMFIFIPASLDGEKKKRMIAHEYGHTIQSLILGPLYLPLIALPSALWCMVPFFERYRQKNSIDYYSFYTERWADKLGEKFLGNNFNGGNENEKA